MKNQTHKPWIMTAKAGGVLEILLYEMIGQDFWTGEGTTAKSFAEDLKAAGSVSKIHLRVNSPGGNVFDGIAIYNTLLSHGAKVTAQVDGLAASIASVIIMAASEISMGDNAMMMIHNPSTVIGGDSNDMRKMADTMDKVKTSMITAYRRHTKKSIDQIGALMDAETWMTAQETVDNGFAEKVITPEGNDADVAANFGQMLAIFRKVPQQIAARFGASTSHTKRVDGENLTSNCFIYVGDEEKTDTWDLPWHFSTEEKTESHLRDALARFDQADIPASEKPAARAKLVRLCKEHGITVSDAKSGKALAKLIAEAEPGECGCACLPCSEENNCQDCAAADCMDDDCEGCPAQAKAKASKKKKAKARAAKLAKRTPAQIAAGEGECGCTCLPCSDENNCQDCTNADCIDDDCEDCPMQAKASAKALAALETKLATANRTIDSLRGDLATAVAASTDGAAAAALNVSWLARISGDLEKGAELTASAVKDLPEERAAAESRIAQLGADLEAAQTALATEKAARLEESGAHAKFSERLSGELRQAGKLHAAAVEEMTDMARLAETRVTQLAAELEGAQSALAGEKKARVEENAAYVQWTGRLTGELSSAGKLYASSIEELSRRIAAAESRVAQTEAELETAQADLAAEKQARVSESTVHVEWSERLTGELSSAGKLYASAMEELPRIAAAEGRVTQISADLETAQAALAAEKKARVEEAAAYVQSAERIAAELSNAGKLCAAAPHRIADAEARVTEITAELETAQAALLAEKKARHEEGAANVLWPEHMRADLQKCADFYAEALAELPRRVRAAEVLAEQAQTHLVNARTAMVPAALIQLLEAESKTRAEEATAIKQFADRVTGGYEKGATLYAEALAELPRRARAAEARVTQISEELTGLEAENTSGKQARSEDATRRTEEIAGLTAELSSAGKVCTDAVEELSRRARTAETGAAQITTELASTQTAMEAGKKARGEETATSAAEIARLTADLTHAGSVYALAVQELPRRARASETAAIQITAELESVEAAIETREAAKKIRVKEKAERAVRTERMTADLKQAGTLYAAAVQELPRRALAAEARVTQINAELESPKPAAEAAKKARAADDANRVQGIERITASLEQVGTLYASALEELHRRARFDEQRVTQITESQTRRDGKKARAEEAEARAVRAQEIERMTSELQQAAAIYASASEEIARRARLAQL
jgi:ATP-dependent protease ClpP protease subunit